MLILPFWDRNLRWIPLQGLDWKIKEWWDRAWESELSGICNQLAPCRFHLHMFKTQSNISRTAGFPDRLTQKLLRFWPSVQICIKALRRYLIVADILLQSAFRYFVKQHKKCITSGEQSLMNHIKWTHLSKDDELCVI